MDNPLRKFSITRVQQAPGRGATFAAVCVCMLMGLALPHAHAQVTQAIQVSQVSHEKQKAGETTQAAFDRAVASIDLSTSVDHDLASSQPCLRQPAEPSISQLVVMVNGCIHQGQHELAATHFHTLRIRLNVLTAMASEDEKRELNTLGALVEMMASGAVYNWGAADINRWVPAIQGAIAWDESTPFVEGVAMAQRLGLRPEFVHALQHRQRLKLGQQITDLMLNKNLIYIAREDAGEAVEDPMWTTELSLKTRQGSREFIEIKMTEHDHDHGHDQHSHSHADHAHGHGKGNAGHAKHKHQTTPKNRSK